MFNGAQGAKGNRVVKTRLVDFDKAVTVSCDGVQCRIGISVKLQSILRQVLVIIAQSVRCMRWQGVRSFQVEIGIFMVF